MTQYIGVTGWFCCGNSFYPYCPPEYPGSCAQSPACNSNEYGECAWPVLYRPGYPYCNYDGCAYYMEQEVCNSYFTIQDVCNYNQVAAVAATCGPYMAAFCGQYGNDCRPPAFYDRIIDLTPATFMYLAPLDQGLASVAVYASP